MLSAIPKSRKLQIAALVALALYLKSKRKHLALAAVLAALAIRYTTGDPSNQSLATLVRYGAEARIYEKYFASNYGIVTFRSERGEHLKILTALTLSSLTRNSQTNSTARSRHVVFVSSTRLAALWAPAMARVLKRASAESTVITHAVEILSSEALPDLEHWLKRDLRGEKVTIVAHGDLTCGLLAKFKSDACMVFVNPLTGRVFPSDLPLKSECLSLYASAFTRFVALTRVLHEDCPPLVDRSIVEYAILSSKSHDKVSMTMLTEVACSGKDIETDIIEEAKPEAAEFTSPTGTACMQTRQCILLCGDQDWWSGRKAYEKISCDLQCARPPVFLRGLGSLPHLEDPDKFAEALIDLD